MGRIWIVKRVTAYNTSGAAADVLWHLNSTGLDATLRRDRAIPHLNTVDAEVWWILHAGDQLEVLTTAVLLDSVQVTAHGAELPA